MKEKINRTERIHSVTIKVGDINHIFNDRLNNWTEE